MMMAGEGRGVSAKSEEEREEGRKKDAKGTLVFSCWFLLDSLVVSYGHDHHLWLCALHVCCDKTPLVLDDSSEEKGRFAI